MTIDEYETRIAALGFTTRQKWAEYIGVSRVTHYRHLNHPEGPPKYLRLIVELLEACPSMNPNIANPNTLARLSPHTDFVGEPIHEGDTIQHPSGQKGVVKYVYTPRACPSSNWKVDYDGPPYSALGLQVGDKGRAVIFEKNPDAGRS